MSMKNFFDEFESFFNDFDHHFNFKPVRILGETKTEKGTDENGNWVKQSFSSKDGSYKITTFYRTSQNTQSYNKNELKQLQKQLDLYVENQEFEKAAELRDKINGLKENNKVIDSLKEQLDEAVRNQDFEKAIKIRDEIKSLQK